MVFLKKFGLIAKQFYQTVKSKLFSFLKTKVQEKDNDQKSDEDIELLIAKEKELVLEMFDTYFLTRKLSKKERKYIQEWKNCFPKNDDVKREDRRFYQGLKEIKKFAEYSKNIRDKNFISEREIYSLGLFELDFYIEKLKSTREEKIKLFKKEKNGINK